MVWELPASVDKARWMSNVAVSEETVSHCSLSVDRNENATKDVQHRALEGDLLQWRGHLIERWKRPQLVQ